VSDIAFEESSEYYENFDYFTDYKVVKVLLENNQDASLWNDAFPDVDNLQFDFTTAIDMAESLGILAAEGCKQLDKVGNYNLGKYLIICKDSDYNYIVYLMNKILNNSNDSYFKSKYIFETKVHSKENIEYFKDFIYENFANRIFTHPSAISSKAPWIDKFYREFPFIIYEPLLKVIFHDYILDISKRDSRLSLKDFYIILQDLNKIPTTNLDDFDDMFFKSNEWKSIKQKINSFEVKIDSVFTKYHKTEDVRKVISGLVEYGINQENSYLFFRGHNIENLLKEIFKKYLSKLYDNYIRLQCEKLSGQQQREKRQQLFNNKKEFDTKSDSRKLNKVDLFKSTVDSINELYIT
jgi:hypothetical protein